MKVLLINPPMYAPEGMALRCMPSIGLGYVAAQIRAAGNRVEVFDAPAEYYDYRDTRNGMVRYGTVPYELARQLKRYDMVGITCLFSNQVADIRNLARACRNPVIGGLHPTLYPGDFDPFPIGGLVDIRCFDPDYSAFPIDRYFDINVPFSPVPRGQRVMPVLATLGCPVGCVFCANTNMWPQHIRRPVDSVLLEIQRYMLDYGADEIQFADDNLLFDQDYAKRLFRGMRPLGIQWCTPNGLMVNRLDADMVALMADSGCYQVTLSIDSGSAKTLKRMRKPVNLDRVAGLTDVCRGAGMYTHGTLVVGVPNETDEDVEETLAWVWDNTDFTSISVFLAWPIPGSRMFDDMVADDTIDRDDAMRVDTTKSIVGNRLLELRAKTFQAEYTARAARRHPDETSAKYHGAEVAGRLT